LYVRHHVQEGGGVSFLTHTWPSHLTNTILITMLYGILKLSAAPRNLVLLVASLSFCGHTELAMPAAVASSSLYQLPDFQMPIPENRGATVRNLQAFQVTNL
jgi:hypothetical protein